MGSERCAWVFLAVGMFVVFAEVAAGKLPKQPETNFRFNCGSDLCTFPIQYCDQDAGYCRYCQTDLCLSQSIPEQCRTFCDVYLGKFTSTMTSYSTTAITSTNSRSTDITTNIALWLIIGLLVVILFLILGLVFCFCRRKKNTNNDTVPVKVGLNSVEAVVSVVKQVSREGELGQVNSSLINYNLLNSSESNSSASGSGDIPNTFTDSTSIGIESNQNEEVRKPLISTPHEEGERDQHENFGETQIMNKDTLVNVQERSRNDPDSGFKEELCLTTTNISSETNKLVCPTEYSRYPVSRVRTEEEDEETEQKTLNRFQE